MQKLLAALAVVGLVAVAAPVNAAENRNVNFLLGSLGYENMPEGDATVFVNGVATTMPIADAIVMTAARAGNVDLGALFASAAPGDAAGVGDIWVLEIGGGSCPAATAVPTPVPFTAFHGQLWTYSGGAGTMTSSGSGIMIDWTSKVLGGSFGSGMTFAGQSDFFCIEFFGLYILFPFIDGVATSN